MSSSRSYANSPDQASKDRYLGYLNRYIDFSMGLQNGAGLGEPKFNTDGTVYQCGWGRPQNDGPALRAASLCRLANLLLDDGRSDLVQLVKTKLYDGTSNSLIKKDLEYVSHNWGNACVNLWEEVGGNHFYTRIVQRRALRDGAKLATRLADSGAAGWYNSQLTAAGRSNPGALGRFPEVPQGDSQSKWEGL